MRMAHGGLLSAIDQDSDQVRIISEVPSGQASNCVCAACRGVLVARKGRLRTHHFAHKASTTESLTHCQETALHNAAKRLVAYHLDTLHIRAKHLNRPTRQFVLPEQTILSFGERLTPENRALTLTEGEIEPSLGALTDFRPDAVVKTEELGKVYVEIHVSHPVPTDKRDVYRQLGLWVLELNLSECEPDRVGLTELKHVVEAEASRHWLSWHVPEYIQRKLAAHDEEVRRHDERQSALFLEDLKKPIPADWRAALQVMVAMFGLGVDPELNYRKPQKLSEVSMGC